MKKTLFLWMPLLVIGLIGTFLFSCVSSEVSVEKVENPFEEEVYFVSGRTLHQQSSLEGVRIRADGSDREVTTSADGSYQLSFTKKGDYTLHFSKEDFIEMVTVASFDEQAPNRSSLTISPQMTKRSGMVEVDPDEEIEITDPTGRVVLRLLRSVAEKTNVSLTVLTELPARYASSEVVQSGSAGASYTTVLIEPAGVELTGKSTLLVNKLASDALTFATVELYERQADYTWKKLEGVTFDKSLNAYTCDITTFSSYSLRIPYETQKVSETVTDHLNGKQSIENCGNMNAKTDGEIQVNQRSGWDYTADLGQSIENRFSGISQADVVALTTVIDEQMTGLQGCRRGYSDQSVLLSKAHVSGNSILHYENYAKETVQAYSFEVTYLEKPYSLPVNIRMYSGMEERYSEKSCYEHSGGQGK